jgi:hypothetical protein
MGAFRSKTVKNVSFAIQHARPEPDLGFLERNRSCLIAERKIGS